jgi:nitrate reductase assembly molybdenum cofactor insertion protein NarJ
MAHDSINRFAAIRHALSYPDESHLALFRSFDEAAPDSLEELRALYVSLFEAGLPHPHCPMIESFYVTSRPAGEVVLENKLFYKHFGLELSSQVPADHLLAQLEFLAWLEHCRESGNEASLDIADAQREFTERHLKHLPRAASLARAAGGACYAAVLAML